MLFGDLATELITQVFFSCNSIPDVLALSSTCYRFRRIYVSSQRLNILQAAAAIQLGPLYDLDRLITHVSIELHNVIREPPLTQALLEQYVRHGRVAEKWCEIYPFKKWKHNYESRRSLTTDELYRLRRAIYRSWLYSRAFHTRNHLRQHRSNRAMIQKRAILLRPWQTWELAEIADVNAIIREVVRSSICPSNGHVERKYRKRFPQTDTFLMFNDSPDYLPGGIPVPYREPQPRDVYTRTYHYARGPMARVFSPTYTRRCETTRYQVSTCEPGGEGWGDDIPHYYVIEDMLKLDPEQILWLKENALLKREVEAFVKFQGDWFDNNGETWGQTLEYVLGMRGEDVEAFKAAVKNGDMGVALE
jgi:hypothetical protein